MIFGNSLYEPILAGGLRTAPTVSTWTSTAFALIGADFGLTVLWRRLSTGRAVGERKARERAYTGRRIHADEALALGILNHLTPAGGALDKVVEVADQG